MSQINTKYDEFATVGLIQTTLNKIIAWKNIKSCNIDELEGDRIWEEVLKGMKALHTMDNQPDIIILPELTIPRNYVTKLCKLTHSTNSIIIAGLDYNVNVSKKTIVNEMLVVYPERWPNNYGYNYRKILLGKFHYARTEIIEIKKRNKDFKILINPHVYIFDSGKFGKIGVAICADFFDIERFALYKGKIQHLFIIAYNQDITSFYFLAEAISRLIFCNVIICNTGFYGGSIVFSPYNSSYKRYLYKHEGATLFTTQSVQIPVKNLIIAQTNDDENFNLGEDRFKYRPPGYENSI